MLLWKVTVSTLADFFTLWDRSIAASPSSSTTVPINMTAHTLTLFVIASAGFDMRFTPSSLDSPEADSGYTMSFGQALFHSIDNVFIRVLVPRWMYRVFGWSKTLRDVETSYSELRRYIGEMIDEARERRLAGNSEGEREPEEAADLFRRLIAANEEESEGGTGRLSDEELVANVFVS